MLNKDICINCHRKFTKSRWDSHYDENSWTLGVTWCPAKCGGGGSRISVYKVPPEYCPYILEHVISAKGKLKNA